MNYLKHLFTPHVTNNFRAKVLHHSFLIVFIVSFLSLACGVYLVKQSYPQVLGVSYSISENELLDATNKMRVANGVAPLTLNSNLSNAARQKAAYMFEKNFWAHFAPDGTTPWSFIKSSNYEYLYAGENLAKGFTNSNDVVAAWMDSPTHRENLLSPKYKDIGFGVQEGTLTGEETVVVVQMFGSPLNAAPEVAEVPENAPIQQVAQEDDYNKAPEVEVKSEQETVGANVNTAPYVSAPMATKSLSVIFLFFIITVLALDLVIVEKKRLPRLLGHNLDHIILLILFLVFILLEKSGGIL